MKILYGIQGTGHGHISRARVVLPKLREFAEVEVLISGYNYKLNVEGEIAYKPRGISFSYDNKGSIDFLDTALNLQPMQFMRDVGTLPVDAYDFVVNDFEPVSAWAARTAGIPCVAISHQASFLSVEVPRPSRKSFVSEQILRYFAPCTAAVGSHYIRYDDFIEPPIIRDQIKALNPLQKNHVTVYLPAFDYQTLCSILVQIKSVEWHIFSPYCKHAYERGNVKVQPTGKDCFLKSIESCIGIISASGFETTSEAMYLGKKLLTIPIRNQYEQLCNAAALQDLGATVVYRIGSDFVEKIKKWIAHGKSLSLKETSDQDVLMQRILNAGQGSTEDDTSGFSTSDLRKANAMN
ncbi:MAG: hypothetical protein FH748_03415 [Balneolaceae bacterium]|nr:hypothetical protein [Balneolaceae bacterium]